MTKTQVKRFLLGFFAIYFGAIFLRIDHFPLTWVPMYAQIVRTSDEKADEQGDEVKAEPESAASGQGSATKAETDTADGTQTGAPDVFVMIGSRERREKGFFARKANGDTMYVSKKTLNIPSANFRRLYMERAFDGPPPHLARERAALMPFNRWWYETLIGPDPMLDHRSAIVLLESVNATLGFGGNDPERIVQLEAEVEIGTFKSEDVSSGNLLKPSRQSVTAVVTAEGMTLRFGNMVTQDQEASNVSPDAN
jgi:hypothetical protein